MRRQIATSVHLVVHVQRSILRVAQIVLSVGVEHAQRQRFLVLEVGPYALTLFAMDDGSAGILTERQNALGCSFGIAQELQSHILVVLRSLRVGENLCHLLVVRTTKHKFHIVERLLCQHCESLFFYFQNGFTFKLAGRHMVLGEQIVFSIILAQLEHRSILKFRSFCHDLVIIKLCYSLSYNRFCSHALCHFGTIASQ